MSEMLQNKISVEPDLNQRPMDYSTTFSLQSTALPTELSTDVTLAFCLQVHYKLVQFRKKMRPRISNTYSGAIAVLMLQLKKG